jgi:hypothetical protein
MHRTITIAAAVAVAAIAAPAAAQTTPEVVQAPPTSAAPRNAAEITVGTGYTQAWGQIGAPSGSGSNNINDIHNGGVGINLGVGYRIAPEAGIAITGEYQEFGTSQTNATTRSARGIAGGIDATFHFMPYSQYDTYLRAGGGYRMLWHNETGGRQTCYHGFEIARAALGLDVRSNADVAFGPVVGAGLDMYLWADPAGGPSQKIDNHVATYMFFGVQGRFNAGGTRETKPGTAMASTAPPSSLVNF